MSHIRSRLVLVCVLSALGVLLLSPTVASASVPSRPIAKQPSGTIMTCRVTFTWSKALRTRTYDLQVFRGTTRLLNKRGLTRRTWTNQWLFEGGNHYSWRVRGRNASGTGPWSRTRRFYIDGRLWEGQWMYQYSPDGSIVTDERRLIFFTYGEYLWVETSTVPSFWGVLVDKGRWTATTTTTPPSITLTQRLESWIPQPESDTSGIPAYTDQPRPDIVWSWALDEHGTALYLDDDTLTITDELGVQYTYSIHHGGIPD